MYVCMYVCVYLPNHSAEYETKSIFLSRVKLVLNSEFLFFETGCLTKIKEPNLYYFLPIARRRKDGFIAFPKGISMSKT